MPFLAVVCRCLCLLVVAWCCLSHGLLSRLIWVGDCVWLLLFGAFGHLMFFGLLFVFCFLFVLLLVFGCRWLSCFVVDLSFRHWLSCFLCLCSLMRSCPSKSVVACRLIPVVLLVSALEALLWWCAPLLVLLVMLCGCLSAIVSDVATFVLLVLACRQSSFLVVVVFLALCMSWFGCGCLHLTLSLLGCVCLSPLVVVCLCLSFVVVVRFCCCLSAYASHGVSSIWLRVSF